MTGNPADQGPANQPGSDQSGGMISGLAQALRGPTIGITIIATVATVWFLDYAESVLVPLAIAFLIWAVVNAQARMIQNLRLGSFALPKSLAMPAAILVTLTALYMTGNVIAANIADIVNSPSQSDEGFMGTSVQPPKEQTGADGFPTGPAKTEGLDRVQRRLIQLTEDLGIQSPALTETITQLQISSYLSEIISGVSSILANAVLILVFTGFLLAEQNTFDTKIRVLRLTPERKESLRHLASNLVRRIQDYISIKTLVSLLTAAVSYAVLVFLNVDYAGFLAFLIFMLNFVPTFGSILGVVFPALQVLVQFEGDMVMLATVIIILGLVPQFLIGNILEPKIMGQSLNLSPMVILVSLAFWAVVWGIPGLFLGVPITVIIMIICAYFGPTRWVAVMLSGDGRIVSEAVDEQAVLGSTAQEKSRAGA